MRELYACRLPLAGNGLAVFDEAVALVAAVAAREDDLAADQEPVPPRPAAVGTTYPAVRRSVLDLRERPVPSPSPPVYASSILRGGGRPVEAPTASRVRSQLVEAPGTDDRVWKLWADTPVEDSPGLERALSVSVAMEGGACWVSVHLGLRAAGRRVVPLRFTAEAPAIVARLVNDLEVVEDGWRLGTQPYWSLEDDGASGLSELLCDPLRALPVVVVSPREVYVDELDVYRDEPLVDPDALAASVVGLAHVVVLETVETTFRLTDLVGRDNNVFGGAVRLYWPGFDPFCDPHDHPRWTPGRLTDPARPPLVRELHRLLVPAAALTVSTTALEARLRGAAERDRGQAIERLFARAREASLAPEWQEELERAWAENDALRCENRVLEEEAAALREYLADTFRRRARDVDVEEGEETGPRPIPLTIGDVVKRAAAECSRLVMLDECLESARRSTYRQPGRAWRALAAMEEVAQAWADGELPGGFRDAFAARGFEFASNISGTTAGKYGREYVGSSRVDLQACKLEYSIVSPK